MTIQSKCKDSYIITEFDNGGNYTSVSIIVSEDGSLRIVDHSYGPLADEV